MNGELPKYNCIKQVRAFKIKDIIDFPMQIRCLIPEDDNCNSIIVPIEYLRKHNPQIGGYYVKYEDGYESFSPAKAFEEGYVLARGSSIPIAERPLEEKKKVELIRGKWYCCDGAWFRYDYTEICKFENKIHTFVLIGANCNNYDSAYFYEGKNCKIVEATIEQMRQGVAMERKNGKFWNDKKQDFLKLEDIQYIAHSINDLMDVYNVNIRLLHHSLNMTVGRTNVLLFKDGFIYKQELCEKDKIEETKEVFVSLLKNYKKIINS